MSPSSSKADAGPTRTGGGTEGGAMQTNDSAQPGTRKTNRLLVGSLVTLFLASALASVVQTAGGRIDIQGVTIPTQNGQWVAGDLFKPETATPEDPAPLVVVVPGFQRTKESLSNASLELARRGIVVLAIDPYAQGGSSSSMSRIAATEEGYGMFALVEYVHDAPVLNYVDRTRIGATGHSAGGNAAIRGANYFGREAAATGEPSKLHSVFVSGYVLTLREDVLKDVRSNVGMSYAYFDEGAFRNELGHGDMRRAPEALRLVNSGLVEAWPSGTPGDAGGTSGAGGPQGGGGAGRDGLAGRNGASAGDEEARTADLAAAGIMEVELGRYYGNKEDRTLRIVHNERVLHPFQPYHVGATANLLAYFDEVFDLESGLSSRDQIWYWKEILTFLALIASFVMIVPLARLLLEIPFFRPLKKPIPEPLPKPRGRGRIIFWVVFFVGALVACISYIPMAELSKDLFVAASTRNQTWFFPQRMNNAVLLWAILNGLFGLGLFSLAYRIYGKKAGTTPRMWGTNIRLPELGKTFLLAVLIFAIYYGILYSVYFFFHVDYQIFFMGVHTFRPVMILILAMYAPLFFIFFFSNSLRVNGAMRFRGEGEGRSMLVAGLANTLGLLSIVVVQYSVFAATGTVYWDSSNHWLYVNLLFAVVPMMFILPYFHRYFFRLTGRTYLGPMTICLIFIMILLSNTVCYIPL